VSEDYSHYLQRYFAVAKTKTAWGLPMPDYWEAIDQAVSRVDSNELRHVTVVQIFAQAFTSKMEVAAHQLTAEEAIVGLQAWTHAPKDPIEPVSAYMVVCAGEGPIVKGPGPSDLELLKAVGADPSYDLVVDQPVILQFEGTPLQIAALMQLKVSAWLDDPGNYEDDNGTDETAPSPEIVFEDMPAPAQIQPATELITLDAAPHPPPPPPRRTRGGQLSMLP